MEEDKITEKVIGCAMTVSNKLGVGFLEKVYENALVIELRKAGMKVEQQKPIPVYYDNQIVGDYYADIVVNDCVIVELKVAKAIDDIHKAQLLNYLKTTRTKVGLILNFGTKSLGIKRMVY
jgi:GxxExxY protein